MDQRGGLQGVARTLASELAFSAMRATPRRPRERGGQAPPGRLRRIPAV